MSRALLAISLLFLAACDSPEAARARGGGPGADTGNRSKIVRMHEGSQQFYKTPHLAPGQEGPVATADHARDFSI